MRLTRRRFSIAAGALTVGLAGYVSRSAGGVARAVDRAKSGDRRGPRRGRANPLALGNTVAVDEPNLELVAENDTVRFPAARNGTEVVEYGTMSFDAWARMEAASVGVDEVWRVVEDRLGDDAGSISRGVASTALGVVVELALTTSLDREGNVASEPTATFERVVDVTPASVTATVSLDGRNGTCEIPVQVVTGTVQLA